GEPSIKLPSLPLKVVPDGVDGRGGGRSARTKLDVKPCELLRPLEDVVENIRLVALEEAIGRRAVEDLRLLTGPEGVRPDDELGFGKALLFHPQDLKGVPCSSIAAAKDEAANQ